MTGIPFGSKACKPQGDVGPSCSGWLPVPLLAISPKEAETCHEMSSFV